MSSDLGSFGWKFKHPPVQFLDEITCCCPFARFLFAIGLLAFRLAVEFILNGCLSGGVGTLGGVVAGGSVESGNGG